jgi:hypothetical protein
MTDKCISIRKTYEAVLNLLTSNNLSVIIISIIPIIYILGYTIHNLVSTTNYIYYFTGAGFTLFSIILLAWFIVILSIWKTMPNLLTVSIFIYKCIGHWSLVSFLILIFYLSQYLSSSITQYLAFGFLPFIGFLIFATDVLRTKRTKMYSQLEAVNSDNSTIVSPVNNV